MWAQHSVRHLHYKRVCDQLSGCAGKSQNTAEPQSLVTVEVVLKSVALIIEMRTQFSDDLVDQCVIDLIFDNHAAVAH